MLRERLQALSARDPELWRTVALGVAFAVLISAIGVLTYLNFFAPDPSPNPASTETTSSDASLPVQTPVPAQNVIVATPVPRPTAVASEPPAPKRDLVDAPAPRVPSGALTELTLYFVSASERRLLPERRPVSVAGSASERAHIALEELTRGSRRGLQAPLPVGTRVRETYIDPRGVVFVDLSREVRLNHPGGSGEELLTVQSIVATVMMNVPESVGVRLLIGGRQQRSLAGHVDLTRVFRFPRGLLNQGDSDGGG